MDGVILSASRMGDQAIRNVAKRTPVVLLNRTVAEVSSVISDNVHAIKKATEHLVGLGHTSICYLAGPEASWADGMRWRGLREAGLDLDLQVRRLGPFLPTIRGGSQAAEQWAARPSTGVIAYNDLMAIGFMQGVMAAGRSVPRDVSVIGFDNILDGTLVEPHLTTIASPLVSLGLGGRLPSPAQSSSRGGHRRARAPAGPARGARVDRTPVPVARPRSLAGNSWQLACGPSASLEPSTATWERHMITAT